MQSAHQIQFAKIGTRGIAAVYASKVLVKTSVRRAAPIEHVRTAPGILHSLLSELARPFEISRPAISKHLRVLERAGLVKRTTEGRISRCELDAAPMRDAAEWVERYRRFWEDQLESLARYLKEENRQKPKESSR